jgi:hypothetical protein
MYGICFGIGALGIFLMVRTLMDVIKEEAKHRIVTFFFGLIGLITGGLMIYWSVKCLVEFQGGSTDTYRSILPLVNKLLGK